MSLILSHLVAAVGGVLAALACGIPRLRRLRRELAAAEYRATHDLLTGLANRRGLIAHLREATCRTEQIGVILLDLHNFKTVNDTPGVGHEGGDMLLRAVARLLAALPAPVRLAARLGGDEFVVVVDGDAEATAATADEIRELIIGAPFVVAGHEFDLGASVGHVASRPGLTTQQLLHYADLAMYEAKHAGGGVAAYHRSTTDPHVAVRPTRRCRDRRRPDTGDRQPPQP